VVGGVRLEEPGADLAVALAVAAAAREAPLERAGRPLAAFGELGLTGEVRQVAHPDRREAEAARFGLAPALGPRSDTPTTVREALTRAFGAAGARRSEAA
jgi:DNA repair protein RadA/Sms